ncbi:MAG TPA: hypothetical protein VNN07_14840 [Candidatus Tectomicrobia bacterium]|nr:hypothetical protein [Candidatus Tectomicrobia bacterium]
MLARALEGHGLPTVTISLVREHTVKVKPPRALFVPFPFGHALGRPHDATLQHRVLRAALDLLAEPAGPVLRDFPEDGAVVDEPPAPRQASGIPVIATEDTDASVEVETMRTRHAKWVAGSGGRTAVGVSGVPVARLGDVARFLARFADGADVEWPDRSPDVPLPNFVRSCADDLKALYWEARMADAPSARGEDIARWFWGETTMGRLLRRVRDRLDRSDDPRWKAAAFGVAR